MSKLQNFTSSQPSHYIRIFILLIAKLKFLFLSWNVWCKNGLTKQSQNTFLLLLHVARSRDSAVGIATGYGLDD
jgi:hypothetical protein